MGARARAVRRFSGLAGAEDAETEAPVLLSLVRPECPPPISRFVMQCLEKDPARRPQSARAMLDALDTVSVAGENVRAFARVLRDRRTIVVAALAAMAILAAVYLARGRGSSASSAIKSFPRPILGAPIGVARRNAHAFGTCG